MITEIHDGAVVVLIAPLQTFWDIGFMGELIPEGTSGTLVITEDIHPNEEVAPVRFHDGSIVLVPWMQLGWLQ